MPEPILGALPDDWLRDLAVAIVSADGGGAFEKEDLARKLAGEFSRRGLKMPLPRGRSELEPSDWLALELGDDA